MSTTQGLYEVGSTGRWSGSLTRDDGTPVPLDDIDAATLLLIDARTKQVVNGRGTAPATGQDVWNAGAGDHGVQFVATTDEQDNPVTLVGWDLAAEDITPLDQTVALATHIATLLVDYHLGAGPTQIAKRIAHRHALEVCDPRRLACTFDDVAGPDGYLREEDPDKARALVHRLIAQYQMRAELYTERGFLKSTVAQPSSQVMTLEPCDRGLYLNRWPIDQVVDVIPSFDGTWTASDALVEGTDFLIDHAAGVLDLQYPIASIPVQVRVRWAGGLFDDVSNYDLREPHAFAVREALAQQVAFKWQRKGDLGISAVTVGPANIQVVAKDWLPEVQAVLDELRRIEL